jgi:hypothetical protein
VLSGKAHVALPEDEISSIVPVVTMVAVRELLGEVHFQVPAYSDIEILSPSLLHDVTNGNASIAMSIHRLSFLIFFIPHILS